MQILFPVCDPCSLRNSKAVEVMFGALAGDEVQSVQILQKCAHFRSRHLIADVLLFLFLGTPIENTEFWSRNRQPSPAPTLQYDSADSDRDEAPSFTASESSPTHSTASEKTITYDYPDDKNYEKESSTKDDEAIGDYDEDRTESDSVCSFDESNAQGVAV
jgi:hypothetical protein